MNKEQSLQILKAAIDEAIRKGAYNNLETIQQIILAITFVNTELNKTE
jgi:hypothetical protein